MSARQRVDPMTALERLTQEEHDILHRSALEGPNAWSPPRGHYTYRLVGIFKSQVKSYYYWRQDHRCCYCSSVLPNHGRAYDAEHIVAKGTYPRFTFHPGNLAASCIICNQHKSNRPVLTDSAVAQMEDLPNNTDDYLIVHPHFDEWGDYFEFDGDGGVVPIHSQGKGPHTFELCGIKFTNLLHLSSKFSGDVREGAYKLMCRILELKGDGRFEQLLDLLRSLAGNSPGALAVVAGLRRLNENP